MDRECVSLLPGVCDVLADSDKCLPDDTSLEKLLDWFSELTAAGQCKRMLKCTVIYFLLVRLCFQQQ